MKRMILTAVTATALALGPVATAPASAADTKDVLGALLGIAALAAIAHEVKENKAERNRTTRRVYNDDGYYYGGDGYRDRSWDRRDRQAKVLPGECLRVLDNGRHDGIVFPARCLSRNGVRTRELPDRCETQVRTREGRIDVYRARCLADAGWTLPRLARR